MHDRKVMKEMNEQKKEMLESGKTEEECTFAAVSGQCFMNRRPLSATGFYKIPDLGFDWTTQQGRAFNYFTHGSAMVEVEVDMMTGEFKPLFMRVVMDVGNSLNPAIDIGQIEGASTQGYGLYTIHST
eukprot:GABW01001372.1.p1 GENE.GABW01001372.1~~GABW01001372.1.p1  ORF type:complete len:128 (-),score=67.06 GABW01001372.1:3-386(-)